MFCRNCGGEIPDNAYVCMHCGVAVQDSQKSKLAAGLLGIFLGGFGAHNFYLGYQNKAVAQLLISVIGLFVTLGIATTVIGIWGFVEGIMILTGHINVDGKGIPLKD